MDRIHAVLSILRIFNRLWYFPDYGIPIQAIIPGVNFTCSGSIESWTFGARWEQDTDFVELQIWRPDSENGSYIKVGNTTINVKEGSQTDLYQYPLSSPLHFQAGDILGYYRRMSLIGVENYQLNYDQRLYSQRLNSSASQFSVDDPQTDYVDQYYMLIRVTTGKLSHNNYRNLYNVMIAYLC